MRACNGYRAHVTCEAKLPTIARRMEQLCRRKDNGMKFKIEDGVDTRSWSSLENFAVK